jgi:formylglycine-generating enzyme required for sulfatase activity
MSEYEVWFQLWEAVASKSSTVAELPRLDQLKKRIEERNKRPTFTGPRQPVVMVDWKEAQEFVRRLRALTHRCYRLPSEAEWERAARADTTGPFALKNTSLSAINHNGEPYGVGPVARGRGVTVDVGSLHSPNAFGLHDMHGNVWEWCQDQWHETYLGAPRDGTAWEDGENANVRVLRGSSWENPAVKARSGARFQLTHHIRDLDIGFRLALSPREQCPTEK